MKRKLHSKLIYFLIYVYFSMFGCIGSIALYHSIMKADFDLFIAFLIILGILGGLMLLFQMRIQCIFVNDIDLVIKGLFGGTKEQGEISNFKLIKIKSGFFSMGIEQVIFQSNLSRRKYRFLITSGNSNGTRKEFR